MNEFKGNPNSPEGNLKSLLFKFCFQSPEPNLKTKIGNYFVLGIAYFAGAFHWAWLINFGNVKYRFSDWQLIINYYEVIQQALAEKSIPYFMPGFHLGTNQFLGILETDLSPTVLLLSFLSIEDYILAQMTVMYSLGFLGCLWLKNKYRWSLISFAIFFLIFNFNGHITSHLAIGHWAWISYFLFPFFIGWVLSLVEGDAMNSRPSRLAWVLFGILLLGGVHPFVWCLMFLILLCLCQKRYWKPIFTGLGLAFLFSLFRTLPAAVTFWGFKNQFLYGFPSGSALWSALTKIYQSPEVVQDMKYSEQTSLPWWEVDHYITLLGLGLILYFGLWYLWRRKEKVANYRVLSAPMLIMTIFSLGAVYGLIAHLPIPLISVERIPSRFLIIPILFLLTLSCIGMQRMFDRLRPGWIVPILAVAGLCYEGTFLMMHSSVWFEQASKVKIPLEYFQRELPVSEWARSVEELYVTSVQVSFLISLAALLAFVAVSIYFRKSCPIPENET